MKRFLLICIVSLMSLFGFANDTYFFMAGGNLLPAEEKDTLIEMRHEKICINLQDNYYEVTVDFVFYNPSKSVDILVGFPFFEAGLQGKGKIWDFTCSTNGKETFFNSERIEKRWVKPSDLEYANIRTVHFNENEITTTKVSYKSEYGNSAPSFRTANYLYGTGESWNKSIGSILLRIENNIKYGIIRTVTMAENAYLTNKLVKTSDNTFEILLCDVEPKNYTDVFEIEISDVINDDGPRSFPGYFPYNKKIVDKKEFKWLRKDQLRIVRNAIYALHGYKFKSKELEEYFTKVGKYWNPPYKVNPDFSEDELTEIEKANIKNLLEEEKRR